MPPMLGRLLRAVVCLLGMGLLPPAFAADPVAEVRVDVRAVPTSDASLLARANAIAGDDAWCRA